MPKGTMVTTVHLLERGWCKARGLNLLPGKKYKLKMKKLHCSLESKPEHS